jgi:hypothetical protein
MLLLKIIVLIVSTLQLILKINLVCVVYAYIIAATNQTTTNNLNFKIMKTIEQQFNEITLMRLFEIKVIDKRTNEEEYIIFNINIENNSFIATHESLTKEQSESNKIAFVKFDIDEDFSLDSHLQELYNVCIDAILESEFFQLAD